MEKTHKTTPKRRTENHAFVVDRLSYNFASDSGELEKGYRTYSMYAVLVYSVAATDVLRRCG